ncbi:MAG: type II toxin-antitoxin system YafQ family toxin [Sulfuricurvum sp.]|jgi:mRNA interferase YafQ
MLKLNRHKQFLKDFSKQTLSEQHYAKYIVYLSKLIQEEPLPLEALDHSLKAEWNGYREFHISGDVLVIYKLTTDTLILARIGSHSELFR